MCPVEPGEPPKCELSRLGGQARRASAHIIPTIGAINPRPSHPRRHAHLPCTCRCAAVKRKNRETHHHRANNAAQEHTAPDLTVCDLFSTEISITFQTCMGAMRRQPEAFTIFPISFCTRMLGTSGYRTESWLLDVQLHVLT